MTPNCDPSDIVPIITDCACSSAGICVAKKFCYDNKCNDAPKRNLFLLSDLKDKITKRIVKYRSWVVILTDKKRTLVFDRKKKIKNSSQNFHKILQFFCVFCSQLTPLRDIYFNENTIIIMFLAVFYMSTFVQLNQMGQETEGEYRELSKATRFKSITSKLEDLNKKNNN